MQKLESKVVKGNLSGVVNVYDGDVEYLPSGKHNNPTYYQSESGGRVKTRPYCQYSAMTGRTKTSHHAHHMSYEGVVVDETFSSFDKWVEVSEKKGGYMMLDNGGRLFQQDKDLLGDGKVYSESTTCFIPPALNSALKVLNSEVRGVRIQNSKTQKYVVVNKKDSIGNLSREEAMLYALKRDKEALLNVVHEYFEVLDDNVVEAIIKQIETLKDREYSLKELHEKQSIMDSITSKFKLRVFNLKSENKRGDLPRGVAKNKSSFRTQVMFAGNRIIPEVNQFKRLKDAEITANEIYLAIVDRIESEFSDVEGIKSLEQWKILQNEKLRLKDQRTMLFAMY